jgi:hypothetical protein
VPTVSAAMCLERVSIQPPVSSPVLPWDRML